MPTKFTVVPGFELYEISRSGIIRRRDTQYPLKHLPAGAKGAYRRVVLRAGGLYKRMFVHQLLGITFIPNPEKHAGMNHKNGIKHDNRLVNLEWCSQQENCAHAVRNKLRTYSVGKEHWFYKKNPHLVPNTPRYARRAVPKADVANLYAPGPKQEALAKQIFELRNQGKRYREITEVTGASVSHISNILRGLAWKH